jgi:hypothetical protein
MGYFNNSRVRPGEEFDGPDDLLEKTKNKWFTEKEKYVPPIPRPAGGPIAISQIARQTSKAPVRLQKGKEETNLDVI